MCYQAFFDDLPFIDMCLKQQIRKVKLMQFHCRFQETNEGVFCDDLQKFERLKAAVELAQTSRYEEVKALSEELDSNLFTLTSRMKRVVSLNIPLFKDSDKPHDHEYHLTHSVTGPQSELQGRLNI